MSLDGISELLSTDFSDAWQRIVEVFFDPASDLQLALLVYAIASLLVIVVLMSAILWLSSSDHEDEAAEGYDDDEYFVPEEDLAQDDVPAAEEPPAVISRPPRSRTATRITNTAFALAAVGLVWFALGAGTAQPATCTGCHTATPHNAERPDTTWLAGDAHEKLACIDCHESAGPVGRYGLTTVARAGHFLAGFGLIEAGEYGTTSSQACLNCHARVERVTVENEARAIRVSHVEPLEAGASCVDCHGLRDGVVSRDIGGMTRCVVCHNGTTAESECGYCHTQDISVAASQAAPPRPETARGIIGTPDCGGCHNLEVSCDPCHGGTRLPHSQEFIAGGHAKEAVRDYWNGSGTACQQCHTATRRPCGTCHQGTFWSHGKEWATSHRSADPNSNNCDACHGQTIGKLQNRNFCIDVCHTDREAWRARR